MNEVLPNLDSSFNWVVPISFAALAFAAGVLIQSPHGRELLSRLPRAVDPLLTA